MCGYLTVVLVMSVEHGGLMGEIDEFFVLPEERSRGTGARLLAAAEETLARRGCVRLQLQLGTANTRGRAFYQRHGYDRRSGLRALRQAPPVRLATPPPAHQPGAACRAKA